MEPQNSVRHGSFPQRAYRLHVKCHTQWYTFFKLNTSWMSKIVDWTNDIRLRKLGKYLEKITQNIKHNDKALKNMIIFKTEDNMIKSNIYLIGILTDNREIEEEYWLKIIGKNDRQHESLDSGITMNHQPEN